jgi:hypothetical protein
MIFASSYGQYRELAANSDRYSNTTTVYDLAISTITQLRTLLCQPCGARFQYGFGYYRLSFYRISSRRFGYRFTNMILECFRVMTISCPYDKSIMMIQLVGAKAINLPTPKTSYLEVPKLLGGRRTREVQLRRLPSPLRPLSDTGLLRVWG